MASTAPRIRHLPTPRAVPSNPLDFFRGLVIALPLGLLLWSAILLAAWWLWRG
jgi:hypothetical protein